MLYKPLMKPAELVLLEFLNTRMNLSPADKQNYFNLKKGYEGEAMFAGLTEKLQCECLILNDLLLEFNGSKFQIDSLILLQKLFYLNEVKISKTIAIMKIKDSIYQMVPNERIHCCNWNDVHPCSA